MKVQHISDVHCEWQNDLGKRFCEELPVSGEVLVLPGDFATYQSIKRNLAILCRRFKYVIHVPGNHEYYLSSRGHIHNKLDKLERQHPNFFSLRNRAVIIEGQRFVGSTLWWSTTDPVIQIAAKQGLNDYTVIAGYSKWVFKENRLAKEFLGANIFPGDIVITHHAPSWQSRNRMRNPSPLDHAYYNDLDDMIIETRPKIWIHGHTHDKTNYTIGDTLITSAPHGYSISGLPLTNRYETFEV